MGQARREFSPETLGLELDMDEKSSGLQQQVDQFRQELAKRDAERAETLAKEEEALGSKTQEIKKRLDAIEKDLESQLAPYKQAIEKKRPDFDARRKEHDDAIARLNKEFLSIDRGLRDSIECMHLATCKNPHLKAIDAIWKELMGEDEKKIEEIKTAHQKQYEGEVADLRQKKNGAVDQFGDFSKSIAEQGSADEKETMASISSINRQISEIRRPIAEQINRIISNRVLEIISSR